MVNVWLQIDDILWQIMDNEQLVNGSSLVNNGYWMVNQLKVVASDQLMVDSWSMVNKSWIVAINGS